MKKLDKTNRIDYLKSIDQKPKTPDDELKFILWKAELNKELSSFWKSMVLGEEEE